MSAGLSRADLRVAAAACANHRAYLRRRRKGIPADIAASLNRCEQAFTEFTDRLRAREEAERREAECS